MPISYHNLISKVHNVAWQKRFVDELKLSKITKTPGYLNLDIERPVATDALLYGTHERTR